jgi:phosphate transport system substrate-binding protein
MQSIAMRFGLLACTAIASFAAGRAIATDMTGAGSTFVYPILAKWSADYSVKTGDRLNYQSIGSGGGIAQIKAGTVDFGATDKPLSPEELTQGGLGQFPVVIGGVIPVVNIAGIKPGQRLGFDQAPARPRWPTYT